MIEKVYILSLLTICSYSDIQSREISIRLLAGFGIVETALIFYRVILVEAYLPWGVIVGIGLLLISKYTRGAVGDGDAVLVIMTGFLLDMKSNLILITGASIAAAVYGLFLMIIKQKNRKEEFAFVPFLLITYTGMVLQ